MINMQPNYGDNACDGRRFQVRASYLTNVANFNLPHLHFVPLLGMTPFEFCRDLWHLKTGLSCGVVCTVLHLAVSVEK